MTPATRLAGRNPKETAMNFPLWIIEIPHQRPATGWKCDSLTALAEAGYSAASDNHDWPEHPTAEDYFEALAHDLHGCRTAESVKELVDLARTYKGHQDTKVFALCARLIADELDLDAAAVRVVLDRDLAPYESVDDDDLARASDALARPLSEIGG